MILTKEDEVTLSYAKAQTSNALMRDMVELVERLEGRLNEFYAPQMLYGCREFIEQCATSGGKMVNGNYLAEHARQVLAHDARQPKTDSEE